MSNQKSVVKADFDQVWLVLSLHGHCDEIGGMQYRRIWRQYWRALSPCDPVSYILHEANCDADGNSGFQQMIQPSQN